MSEPPVIGAPFRCVEANTREWLSGLGRPLVVCGNEPPWAAVRATLTGVDLLAEVSAWDMDLSSLTAKVDAVRDEVGADRLADATVVGVGGGTALDTAKFVAWQLGRPLVQVPTITSVDAGFTDAIGVRDAGRVRYIGNISPECVVLDLPLVRAAPARLNRAGVGDILSCHTGVFDWRLAADAGLGHAWDEDLAALGARLLDELDAAAVDVAAVSDDGVRFLADAYRRIGAACAWAGHSRFEEGSEHFWAYSYEQTTGAHPLHGEIIAFAVCALAHVQGNDPMRARRIVERTHVRAHPADLGIAEADFMSCLLGLAAYARDAGLDVGVADLRPITVGQAAAAWTFVEGLPRRP